MKRLRAASAAILLFATSAFVMAQSEAPPTEPPTERSASAPEKHEVTRHGLGGSYFAPKDLQERYDGLLARVESLRAALDRPQARPEDPSPSAAAKELTTIEKELEALRAEIDRRSVFVTPFASHTKTTVQEFPLQECRLAVIEADAITLRGWDGPGMRVTLEKTVLWPKDDPAPPDSIFDAIKIDYALGPNPELVGNSAEQAAADEAEFLASPEGEALSPEHAASRAELVASIAESRRLLSPFQGQPIHSIELTGLTGDSGNEWIMYRIESPDGGAGHGGDWRRHARLTIELPPLATVAVLGCQVGFRIENVSADVILSNRESRDRDYDGSFVVDGVAGDLTTEQVPLDVVRGVSGDVTIAATSVMRNGGTQHGPDGRRDYVPPARPTTVAEIGGRLTANFLEAELSLEGVDDLNVRNDYGDIRMTLTKPLAAGTHRLISRSGSIEVRGPSAAWDGSPPLSAYTQVGTIETDLPQAAYDFSSFGGGGPTGQSWRGLTRTTPDDPLASYYRIERPESIETDASRSPGFDCVSHAGTLVLRATDAEP